MERLNVPFRKHEGQEGRKEGGYTSRRLNVHGGDLLAAPFIPCLFIFISLCRYFGRA